MNKKNKLNEVYGGDQQIVKSFDKIFSKGLDDNVIDKEEHDSFLIFSKKCKLK